MCLRSDNVFLRLEEESSVDSAIQLALVVAANRDEIHAFEMLAGKRAGLDEQRKRLLVSLAGARRKGPDDYRSPFEVIQAQAWAYIKHQT